MMSMKAETEEKLTKPMAADTAADKKDVKWTPAQLEAITLKGTDILVGAAAGSGKTASLTERIVSSIVSGGADVSRILAVTFTKAAAAELKSRISNALRRAAAGNPGNRRIARQLSLLPGASIGTIHSFCLTLLRSHYAELGIPPDIRVADEAEASLLRRECMEETIDAFYNGDLTIKSTNLDFKPQPTTYLTRRETEDLPRPFSPYMKSFLVTRKSRNSSTLRQISLKRGQMQVQDSLPPLTASRLKDTLTVYLSITNLCLWQHATSLRLMLIIRKNIFPHLSIRSTSFGAPAHS